MLVPAAAVALVLLFRAQPMVAAGVMVVAVCPGAPYGPPFTGIAKGDVHRAVGLMVILAGSSALLAPLLLQFLLPLVAPGGQAKADAVRIVRTLAVVQFLPLCAGLAVAAYRPALARRLQRPLGQSQRGSGRGPHRTRPRSRSFACCRSFVSRGYAGMLALLAASAAAGWLLGGRGAAARKTLAITTSVRNVGVGLVIAGGSFPGTPAVTFTTAYAIFQTVLVALAVLALGRRAGPRSRRPAAGNRGAQRRSISRSPPRDIRSQFGRFHGPQEQPIGIRDGRSPRRRWQGPAVIRDLLRGQPPRPSM